jgi:septal ring factor EnvC (AmiA/AmiB activator)
MWESAAQERHYKMKLELSLKEEESKKMHHQLKSYATLLGSLEEELSKARDSVTEVQSSVAENNREGVFLKRLILRVLDLHS